MKYNLTVAIIGTGYMGKTYTKILDGLVNKMVFCSTDEEAGRALAKQYSSGFYTDYLELFEKEKIDFAAICLPTHLHCEASLAAMERGISVLCEKPFASTEEEARKMIKTAENNGVLFMVAHCLRFSKSYEYLRRCISDGRFGKLLSLSAYREGKSPTWSVGNWLHNTALSGGVVRDLHIHDTDRIIGWLGEPKSVYTTGSCVVCRTVYDYGTNLSVSASASWRDIKSFPSESGYDALFEHASVRECYHKVTVYTDDESFDPFEREAFSEFFSDSIYENEIKYFCHCLVNKEFPSLCPPEESLTTISVNCAELKSLESNAKK